MRIRSNVAGLAAAAVFTMAACANSGAGPSAANATVPTPAGRAGAPQAQLPVMPDSIATQNERWVAEITASIAGRGNLPAEQVFKDIQLLKGQSATRVLAIMNQDYSRALGVSCAHCHNTTKWEASDREEKTEARGMIRMVTMINEGNRTIPEFGDSPPVINCVVCHRGARRPVPNLPGQGGGRGG